MGIGRGKLIEDLKVQQVISAGPFTATSVSFGRGSIDTKGYDEMLLILNVGDVLSSSTFSAKLYECDQDVFTSAVPVTGGTLVSTMSSSDDMTIKIGNVLTKNHKRYMWVGAQASGTFGSSGTQSTNIAVTAVLGRADTCPVGNVETIDVE